MKSRYDSTRKTTRSHQHVSIVQHCGRHLPLLGRNFTIFTFRYITQIYNNRISRLVHFDFVYLSEQTEKKNAHKVNTLYNTPSSINGRIKRLSSFIFVIIKSKYSVVQCIIHGKRQYQPHTIHFGANALNGQLTHEESCKFGCALLVNRQ